MGVALWKVEHKGKYIVNGKTLNSFNVQMDHGVQVSSSLIVVTQVDRVVKKLNAMLAFIY